MFPNPTCELIIPGNNNRIEISAYIKKLVIKGNSNYIDCIDPKCKIDYLKITGINNTVNLNYNCSQINYEDISNNQNQVIIDKQIVLNKK